MFNAKHIRYPLIGVAWLFAVILIGLPLLLIVTQAFAAGLPHYFSVIGDLLTLDAINLTVLATAIAVIVDTLIGLAAAWALTFYDFPGKRLLSLLIDLPIAVSPVIAGLIFVLTFANTAWTHPLLDSLNIQVVYAKPAIFLATIFVSFPLVAKTLLPVMAHRGRAAEQAAAFMGASAWTIAKDITLPAIRRPLLEGMILAATRAMGEFGAVAVVSGSIPHRTLTLPLLIQTLYDDFKFTDAFAVSTLLLVATMAMLAIQHAAFERR